MMAYQALLDEVLSRAFPEDVAENLTALYEKRVLDGLIELQRYCPQLKARQWSIFEFPDTLFRQGATSFTKPPGKVRRVAAFNSATLKDIVYYDSCMREEFEQLLAQRARMEDYPDAFRSGEAPGYFPADVSLDRKWRAERAVFCIDDNEILVLPHIDSGERILVEWKGSVTQFSAAQVVDFGKYEEQVLNALALYVASKARAIEDRSMGDWQMLDKLWREAATGLIIDAKSDAEEELPLMDVGMLPRRVMPGPTTTFRLDALDATDAWLNDFWMWCQDDGKFYSFAALAIEGRVVEMVAGQLVITGKAESSFEQLQVEALHLLGSDGKYYAFGVAKPDGILTESFTSVPADPKGKTISYGISARYLDLPVAGQAGKYGRITLRLRGGAVTIFIQDAP